MSLRHFLSILLSVVCLSVVAPVPAQDLEREKRLEAEIIDAILDGEAVHLKADGHAILGIYMESEGKQTLGGALILHGRGFHPDWPEVVQPLRTALPASGWNTLSLQMPVLKKDAKYYDYVPILPAALPRIRAGIEYLRAQGAEKVVIIAHSCSVHMSMAYVEQFGDGEIDAYVGIGMGATDYGQPMRKPFPLDKMRVPVLDIYGADEFPAVIRMAPERWAAMRRAGHKASRQVVIPKADHYFTDRGEPLVTAVSHWLEGLRF